ncbi:hypothetical protein LSAT2_004815 [Lamellibrachia satsuma]|nr:hypothetical protein LSAT2_004815 [Lamellibrachia satsuma]
MKTVILYNKPWCADVFHADHNLPSEAIYSDDADFISTDHEYPSQVNEIAPTALGDWFMADLQQIGTRLKTRADLQQIGTRLKTRADLQQIGTRLKTRADLQLIGTRLKTRADLQQIGTRLKTRTDLQQIGMRLKTRADLEQLRRIFINKAKWRKLHRTIREDNNKRNDVSGLRDSPNFTKCQLRLVVTSGGRERTVFTGNCSQENLYSNHEDESSAVIEWVTRLDPLKDTPPQPSYITTFKLGVVSTSGTIVIKDAGESGLV